MVPPMVFICPFLKLHSILAVVNLLAHNNITMSYLLLTQLVARNGQVNTF